MKVVEKQRNYYFNNEQRKILLPKLDLFTVASRSEVAQIKTVIVKTVLCGHRYLNTCRLTQTVFCGHR